VLHAPLTASYKQSGVTLPGNGEVRETRQEGHDGNDAPAPPVFPLSRRSFLIGVAAFSSSLLLAGCGGTPDASETSIPGFLQPPERDFVRAAIARLIPRDALGPGALEAGVDVFIDSQLAGPFGQAAGQYMQGPFHLGAKEQGYQLPFTPAQVYRVCIPRVDRHCRDKLGAPFARLHPDQQDQVLHDLQDGKIDLGEIPSTNFFDLLWRNTKEGFFADPIYGGNRDFIGWKLIGYPGPRYNYVNEIEQYGQPYRQPYTSLAGRQPVMCRLSDSPTGRFDGPGCDAARLPAKQTWDSLTTTKGRVYPAGHL
jgi:gluconate 2-dehydrogenase gamma chain